MFASSLRRLAFVLIFLGLTVPVPASAVPWGLGGLRAKTEAFFSALWAPVVRIIEPTGSCDATSATVLRGCRSVGTAQEDSVKPAFGRTGCVILPDGRCGT